MEILLIIKLIIKSYLQFILLKKTIQSKHYLQFLSIEKKTLNFDWKKFIPLKIYIFEKKIQLKNGSFQLN